MSENPTIAEAVRPVVAARGLELYDVEVTGTGRARVVRVLLTAPAGAGLDLDTIAEATELISPALDAPDVARRLPGPYALEVSSPGLERPLRRPEHFRGALGETVSVKQRDAQRERGTITAADDDGFELEGTDGTRRRFAYGDVVQARTIFEWDAAAAPGRARR